MKPLSEREWFELPDGCRLKIHAVPAKEQRGVLVFAHGMLEYGGRYADWGAEMARQGYTFLGIDHRGHGASDGPSVWMDRLDDLVDDFCVFVQTALDEYAPQSIPVFIVGMSMGGGIAVRTAARMQNLMPAVSGVVLVAPALREHPRINPWYLRLLAPLLNRWCPRWRVLNGGTAGLCHDPKIIENFRKDPMNHLRHFPVHYGVENLRALPENRRLAEEIRLPLLMLQGTGDLIILPDGAVDFVDRLASADKTIRLYPGLYHDLLHEPEKDQINADIVEWLNARC